MRTVTTKKVGKRGRNIPGVHAVEVTVGADEARVDETALGVDDLVGGGVGSNNLSSGADSDNLAALDEDSAVLEDAVLRVLSDDECVLNKERHWGQSALEKDGKVKHRVDQP
jgi:hypothetical protein